MTSAEVEVGVLPPSADGDGVTELGDASTAWSSSATTTETAVSGPVSGVVVRRPGFVFQSPLPAAMSHSPFAAKRIARPSAAATEFG